MSEIVPVIAPPVRDPAKEHLRRRRSFWRKFLAIVILLMIAGFLGVMSFTHTNPLQAVKLLAGGMNLLKQRVAPVPPFNGKSHVNILVLGADVSFDGSGTARTDTIKLVSLDLEEPRVAILSIPRDTWVEIPDHGHGRINGAYQLGGKHDAERIAFAKRTVTRLLRDLSGEDINIDHFVRIQTGGFVHIVDAMGGVTVDVEKKMDYEDPSQELYIHLKPGLQRLNGEQAMGYVRFRMDAEGDYGRIRRQDQFIRAIAAQLRDPKMKSRLPRMAGPMMSMLKTDINEHDLLTIKCIIEQVGIEGIHSLQLPTVPTRKGRAQVVEVDDREAAAQTIAELLHGPRTTVVVLNGSQRTGLAKNVCDNIDNTTYNILQVGTTLDPVASSTVLTVPRCKTQADALATALGIPTVITEGDPPAADYGKRTPIPAPAEVTIVLGNDFSEQAEAHADLPASLRDTR